MVLTWSSRIVDLHINFSRVKAISHGLNYKVEYVMDHDDKSLNLNFYNELCLESLDNEEYD